MTAVGEKPAASTPASAPRQFAGRLLERFPRLRTMLVLTAAVAVLNVVHLANYSVISPFDEHAHIDSLIRGSRGQILVQPDDVLLQETLQEVACRDSEHVTGWPRCNPGGTYKPKEFVYKGWNQASTHSPYYYVITGLAARALRAPPPQDSLVTWARVLGTVWLLLGFYLVLRAAEIIGVPRVPVVLALVLFASAPPVLHAVNTVNPDTTGILSGAIVLLAVLAWERRSVGLWVVGIGAFICAALDTTNVVAVALLVLYLGLRGLAVHRGRAIEAVRSVRDYVRGAGAALAGAFAGFFSWVLVYGLLAHDVDLSDAPQIKGNRVDSFEIEMVLGGPTLFGVLPPVSGYVPGILNKAPFVAFAAAAVLLVTGALLGTAFRSELADRVSTLALAATGALILVPPLLVLWEYFVGGIFFKITTRQVLSTVPVLAIVLAGMARNRIVLVLLAAVAAGLYLSTIMTLQF